MYSLASATDENSTIRPRDFGLAEEAKKRLPERDAVSEHV